METLRVVKRRGYSTFIGLDAAINLEYTTRNEEETACTFCPNNYSRTFIDTKTPDGQTSRYIAGFSCESGTVESKDALKELNAKRRDLKSRFPNLVDYESKLAFRSFHKPEPVPEEGTVIDDIEVRKTLLGGRKRTPIRRAINRSGSEADERR
jgi:hypothetical protein